MQVAVIEFADVVLIEVPVDVIAVRAVDGLEVLFEGDGATIVKAIVEFRLQVAPREFRIPDVMVIHPGEKQTQIIHEASLLCIEVLSPEDRFSRLKKKAGKYLALGVPHIWAFDPATREAYLCDAVATPDIAIPNTPIRLTLASVFSILDDRQ